MAKQVSQHPEEFRIISGDGWSSRVTREDFEAQMKCTWSDVMNAAAWEMLACGRPGWVYSIGGEA